jgi:hypothetical protein
VQYLQVIGGAGEGQPGGAGQILHAALALDQQLQPPGVRFDGADSPQPAGLLLAGQPKR